MKRVILAGGEKEAIGIVKGELRIDRVVAGDKPKGAIAQFLNFLIKLWN